MARLPIPGSDVGVWATILNSFLTVSLNADGTLNPSAVSAATGRGLNLFTGYYHPTSLDRTGAGDATASLNSFIKSLPPGATGYIAAGVYKITGPLVAPAAGCRLLGSGSGKGSSGSSSTTVFSYQPTAGSTMMSDPTYATFQDIQFLFPNNDAASGGSSFFRLSGTTDCHWLNCTFQGQHNSASDAFAGSAPSDWGTGIYFTAGARDSQVSDCWFLNMGRAIVTESGQNYVTGGKFGSCSVAIDAQGVSGGMCISNVTFLGQGGSIGSAGGVTPYHIRMSGGNGPTIISQCWFEGADISVSIVSNPTQLVISQCKISAYTTCVQIHGGNYPTIMGVQTGNSTKSYDVTVPVFAFGLTSFIAGDSQFTSGRANKSAFPAGSMVENVKF